MKLPTAKELKPLVRVALSEGWELTKTGGNHWKLRSPAGPSVVFSSTGSDQREFFNLRADLRRNGLRGCV